MKTLTAFAIRFQRKQAKTKAEDWEPGIFVGRDDADENGIIIDMNGEVVPSVWDYYDNAHSGCFQIQEEL